MRLPDRSRIPPRSISNLVLMIQIILKLFDTDMGIKILELIKIRPLGSYLGVVQSGLVLYS